MVADKSCDRMVECKVLEENYTIQQCKKDLYPCDDSDPNDTCLDDVPNWSAMAVMCEPALRTQDCEETHTPEVCKTMIQ